MVLECYTWILNLFKKIIGYPNIDDEHTSKDRPLIIRYSRAYRKPRIFIIDGKSEKECKPRGLKVKASESVAFISCCNGLVLLASSTTTRQLVIISPLENKITERISFARLGYLPCGLFFHPVAKEYRILNLCQIKDNYYAYHLYLFGTRTWRRTLNPYFDSRPPDDLLTKDSTSNGNPAISNGALHWYMGQNILIFDMIRESFCFKPFPYGQRYIEKGFCLDGLLVNEQDRLCCCYMRSPEPLMDVWVLEDYEKWSWIIKYKVNLDWDNIKYPLEAGSRVGPHILKDVFVVSIHKDELVLYWTNRGTFSYHLGNKTIEKVYSWKSVLDDCVRSILFMDTPIKRTYGFMACATTSHN